MKNRIIRFGIWVFAGWLLTIVPVAAADQVPLEGGGIESLYGDEEFVSIATGSNKPVYKVPAVASVITARQIEAMGARTLDEVLETVPGLHVSLSSLNQLNSVYSIRGIHTSNNPHALVLMNGIPFPLLNNGGRPYRFQLPLTAINRIEILRGPGSAIYGADAFSGVINIITKQAEDINGTETGVRTGSFNTHDLWVQHGKNYGDVELMVSLEWQKSDGDRGRTVTSDLQTTFDEIFSTDVSHAPGPLDTRYNVFNSHLELTWKNWTLRNWYWQQNDAGVGAGVSQALDPEGYNDIFSNMVELGWESNDLSENWDFLANINYYYLESENYFNLFPAGSTVLVGSDGNISSFPPLTPTTFPEGVIGNPGGIDQTLGLELTAIYTGFLNHRLRFGTGYKFQKEDTSETKNYGPSVNIGELTDVSDTPYVFMPDTDRKIWFLLMQDEWQVAPDWEITAGVRYDYYSDFGATINPRFALVWETRHNLTSKLLYGSAFRAPSFSEQFDQNNPVVLGNPDLDPETIDTVEVAFDYRPTFNLHTNLSFFGYQANGLIEFTTDANGISKTAQNARDQLGYGFEIEIFWDVTDTLKLTGNYAWQRSEDKESNNRIADAPEQQIFISADWKFSPDWLAHPQITWIADRPRSEDDPREEIDDYALVDFTLRRINLWKDLDIGLKARNIFDKTAYEPSSGLIPDDYPLEGRSYWLEASYRF